MTWKSRFQVSSLWVYSNISIWIFPAKDWCNGAANVCVHVPSIVRVVCSACESPLRITTAGSVTLSFALIGINRHSIAMIKQIMHTAVPIMNFFDFIESSLINHARIYLSTHIVLDYGFVPDTSNCNIVNERMHDLRVV